MAIRNYLKVFADNTTEATVEKPAFGEVSASGDYYINGLWHDKLGVAYPTQFTYMAKDDKLATFLIEDGQPVDITFDDDSPSIVQNVIQAKDMVVVDKLKINNTEWLNDGIDYDDPDAIGANPVAKIYPDGTIVGSTDNGNYIKYPNGELECRGEATSSSSGVATNTFPCTFVGAIIVQGTQDTSSSTTTLVPKISAYTQTTFSSVLAQSNSGINSYSNIGFSYIAKGAWK